MTKRGKSTVMQFEKQLVIIEELALYLKYNENNDKNNAENRTRIIQK